MDTTVGLEESPECSRCISKAIECRYPANTPKATELRVENHDNAPIEREDAVIHMTAGNPSVDNLQNSSEDCNMIQDGTLVTPDLDFANLGEEYLDGNEPGIDFSDFINPQTHDPDLALETLSSVHYSTPSTTQTTQQLQDLFSTTSSIPRAPSTIIRLLLHRPKMQTGAQRIANLILHNLKSYPLMMLRYNTLPPFIHASLVSSDVEDINMEPLSNCISMVHMISSGVRGSRMLFWNNVRMECERFSSEYLRMNKWQVLAAMQALSIYVLIRLDEGETDNNNFDFLLITTVIVIAQQFGRTDATCHMQCVGCDNGLESSWREWIFKESRRRMAVVYRVVNMLIYFEPAAMCDMPTDLILAPLPAKKQLWEASDEFAWKVESQREPGIQTSFGLAADGELVKLGDDRLSCSDAWVSNQTLDARASSRNVGRWEEWCAGIDGFGGLVMLAASLIV
ncbi:hypothetical protein GLAREA_06763 [Glarea lozoyensis ATCC 20868]|uniref:Transcription factor domain-containing protein n=1 Tax=Glarea lozoyensis (strain ATCC 20868 / MF5171) TaxID=1116229 RepID=S3D7M4_GLAL2|nr:uncharacterized protein GLAREA_06763 [Glarea lozoyensis ATCC 20868]EPE33750.1 hypothetical protein GLAREA_06763 [Glarea lozoyensis ATCC 20868]